MGPDPRTRTGGLLDVCALANLGLAAAWGLAGLTVLAVAAAFGGPADRLPPVAVLAGAGLLAASGVLLWRPGPDYRPRGRAVLALVLAAGCGLGYGEWAAAQYRFDLSGPTPKMAVLVYGPALTAAGCLVEVAYLVWARASAAPAEPGVTPDPRAGDDG